MAEAARAPARESARSVTVKVAGVEYRLRTDQDEDLAREAAALVTVELERLRKIRNAPAGQEALILAALNLAGELLQARQTGEEERRDFTQRLEGLLKKIEERL